MKRQMEAAIARLKRGKLKGLRSAVTWESYTGLGGDYGDTPTYGTATTIYGHLLPGERKTLSAGGQEVLATATLIIPENKDIDIKDRLTLPDSTTPQIIRVGKLTFAGITYGVEVFLGA